ncbi:MAG: hypothetical protein ACT4O9_10915 [Blastocatellia bacterium]
MTASEAYAWLVRQEFLRDTKFIGMHSIVGHQQPSGKTVLDQMITVASGGLRYLSQKGMDESLDKLRKLLAILTGVE